MAIASWLMLKPPPQVILLSSSGERARPELVDSHVEVLANVDLKGCAVVLCSLFSELDLVSAIQSISSVAKDDLVVYVPSPVVVQQAWLDNLLYLAEYFSSCGLQSFLISGETYVHFWRLILTELDKRFLPAKASWTLLLKLRQRVKLNHS